MLIAATHTHSAPAVMGIVSVPPDKNYIAQLIDQIPKGIERAVRNLEPAPNRLAVIQDWERTHTRRWIHVCPSVSIGREGPEHHGNCRLRACRFERDCFDLAAC
jgi:hypothetical protein